MSEIEKKHKGLSEIDKKMIEVDNFNLLEKNQWVSFKRNEPSIADNIKNIFISNQQKEIIQLLNQKEFGGNDIHELSEYLSDIHLIKKEKISPKLKIIIQNKLYYLLNKELTIKESTKITEKQEIINAQDVRLLHTIINNLDNLDISKKYFENEEIKSLFENYYDGLINKNDICDTIESIDKIYAFSTQKQNMIIDKIKKGQICNDNIDKCPNIFNKIDKNIFEEKALEIVQNTDSIYTIRKIQKYFKFNKELISNIVQDKIKNYIRNFNTINYSNLKDIISNKNEFYIKDNQICNDENKILFLNNLYIHREFMSNILDCAKLLRISDKELSDLLINRFKNSLYKDRLNINEIYLVIKEYSNKLNISKEKIENTIFDKYIELVSNPYDDKKREIEKLTAKFDFDAQKYENQPDITNSLQIIKYMRKDRSSFTMYKDNILELLKNVQDKSLVKKMFNFDSIYYDYKMEFIKNNLSKFGINENYFLTNEFINNAKQGLINRLKDGNIHSAVEIRDKFLQDQIEFLTSKEVLDPAKQGLINRLNSNMIDNAVKIRDEFLQNQIEFLTSKEVLDPAKEGLINSLNSNMIDNAVKTRDEFLQNQTESLQSTKVIDAAKQRFIYNLNYSRIDNAVKIRDVFLKEHPGLVLDAAKQGLINILNYGNIDTAVKIRDEFLKDETEFLTSDEVLDTAQKGLILCLEKGYIDKAIAIFDEFLEEESIIDILSNLITEKKYSIVLEICASSYFDDFLKKIPNETLNELEIIKKIAQSPSQEIKRIQSQIVEQLSLSGNIQENYNKIEQVFIKNNLPLFGKTFHVFQILYPDERIKESLNINSSPVLKHVSKGQRKWIFYKDLLKINIESNNYSLRKYLRIFNYADDIIKKFEIEGEEKLTSKEKEKLKYFFDKLDTLYFSSTLGRSEGEVVDLNKNLKIRYEELRKKLNVKEKQTINQRIAEMFLRPLGYKSIKEVLDKMNEKVIEVDKRSREIVKNSEKGYLKFNEGDLLKGVNLEFIENILQNGNVSKEFLGAFTPGSDTTPFDTDCVKLPFINNQEFIDIYRQSPAFSYGDVCFVIRNRGQFQENSSENYTYTSNKYELFKTGLIGESHYGIRTGIGIIETDFLISKIVDEKKLNNLYYQIAQNGYYIPVTNEEGKIIFTPEMFDELRKTFDGVDKYLGKPITFESVKNNKKIYSQISLLISDIKNENIVINTFSQKINNYLAEILKNQNIKLKDKFDMSILGAELFDTGSTGRNTSVPGSAIDFDLTLRLDDEDYTKVKDIISDITKQLKIEKQEISSDQNNYTQLRMYGVEGFGDKKMNIDIGFTKKSEIEVYSTDKVIKDKLENIQKNSGNQSYDETLANIVLCKKLLKEGKAYKKMEDGGFGGVGVETWILANNGNIINAFQTFHNAAYENDKRISFENFKNKYRLLDAGYNLRFGGHDNFINILKPEGYEKMLDVIDKFLKENK
jgi:hypothetical protein